MSWMESNIDFLDVLASQQQESSFTPDLLDLISSLPVDNESQYPMTVFNDLNTILQTGQDAVLTPPESPEQVLPVIKLEETNLSGEDHPLSPCEEPSFLAQDVSGEKEVFQDAMDFNCIVLSEQHVEAELQDSPDFIGSPLSADDVESMLSSSGPASPQSPTTSSFIQSSPELYKVIATPSNVSHRFSPYSKQRPEPKQKSLRSRAKKDSKKLDVLVETEVLDNLDKKDRKRLQNKNAAIRYRQKKKEEAKNVYSEVETLENYNQELKTKVEDLEREVRYMKNLMQEIQKAKGLVQ